MFSKSKSKVKKIANKKMLLIMMLFVILTFTSQAAIVMFFNGGKDVDVSAVKGILNWIFWFFHLIQICGQIIAAIVIYPIKIYEELKGQETIFLSVAKPMLSIGIYILLFQYVPLAIGQALAGNINPLMLIGM